MTDLTKCKICDNGPFQLPEQVGGGLLFDCSNCGDYWLTGKAIEILHANRGDPVRGALLAHLVRRRSRAGERTKVTSELVDLAFEQNATFPTAIEQVENLVIWLAENAPYAGQPIDIERAKFQAIVGAMTRESFVWTLKSAVAQGWIGDSDSRLVFDHEDNLLNASLTLSGWEWYESIGRRKRSRLAFMAMKYGDTTLDELVKNYFVPAVKLTGFDLRRLDSEPQAGIIDNRLRVEIRRSRFVVCDLTHGNQGAYWEAGFAEGIGIPVIYTCEATASRDKKMVHFDTRNSLIIRWETGKELDAVTALKATIRNTLPEEANLSDPS